MQKNEGLDVDNLSKKYQRQVWRNQLQNIPLEEMIDTTNIHGWLQEKINSAEGRMAAWTTKIS